MEDRRQMPTRLRLALTRLVRQARPCAQIAPSAPLDSPVSAASAYPSLEEPTAVSQPVAVRPTTLEVRLAAVAALQAVVAADAGELEAVVAIVRLAPLA